MRRRTDENAKLFFDTTDKKALDHTFPTKPSLPGKRKRKRPNYKSVADYMQVGGYDNDDTVYYPATAKDYYKQQYFETLDLVISSIKERFDQAVLLYF